MAEYSDPDLETIAPLPPAPDPEPLPTPPKAGNRPWVALVAGLVVVALLVGFGVATVVLNLGDSGSQQTVVGPGATTPGATTPGATTPGATTPGATTPGATTPGTTPVDPDDPVLAGLIVGQRDVPATDTVHHVAGGADTSVATLDLCNGTFPSEADRTARRQVWVGPTVSADTSFSTEAVLYRSSVDGAQALRELSSVVAQCPPAPVPSPVGEPTVTTMFSIPPDGSWPPVATVQRQAYSFTTIDDSGTATRAIAVYLRRGRALMGIYFAAPDAAQIPVDGHTSIAEIVGVFEARMAKLPASVVNR